MKKILFLLSLPFPAFALLITEVQIHGDFANNDYIKIYNNQEKNIDVSGFKLRKRTATGSESSIRVFPQGSIIPSKEYFIWANSKDDFHLEIKANVWSTAYLSKNNSIALLDTDNNILDSLSWGQAENTFIKGDTFSENPEKNQSLKRKKINSEYENTNDVNSDFYLFPEIIEKEETIIPLDFEGFSPGYDRIPFINALFISSLSGLTILFLKKLT